MGDETGDVTELLHALSGKEPQTAARLFALLYGELKRLAAFNMRSERGDHTLTPTALVHEAWIRLSPRGGVQDREHFMALAAQAMRRVLVDHARARRAQSRGGDSTMLSIDWFDVEQPLPAAQLIELDEALNRLAAMKPRVAQVIELRFFWRADGRRGGGHSESDAPDGEQRLGDGAGVVV